MVKAVEYEQRRKKILAAAVDFYIRNASAVSSEIMARSFDCSSATIRNIMAELEEMGLLAHTYTSSGRIPTDKGYRFYVDNLLLEIELLQTEKDQVIQEYQKTQKELDVLLEKTSDILSSLTHCAGIVSFTPLEKDAGYRWDKVSEVTFGEGRESSLTGFSDSKDKVFYRGLSFILDYPEFNDLNRIKGLMNLLERKERLLEVININLDKKLQVYIGKEFPFADINDCTLIISDYRLNNKTRGRIAILGPTRMQYARVIPAIEYISNILSNILNQF